MALLKVWFSQLDDRTTLICIDASGQVQPFGTPFYTMNGLTDQPPAHWGCRSIIDLIDDGDTELELKQNGQRYDTTQKAQGDQEWALRQQDAKAHADVDRWYKEVSKASKQQRPPEILPGEDIAIGPRPPPPSDIPATVNSQTLETGPDGFVSRSKYLDDTLAGKVDPNAITGDEWLTGFGEELGYGRKPTLMSQSEFEEYARVQNRKILNRGVRGTRNPNDPSIFTLDAGDLEGIHRPSIKLADQFRTGDYFQGQGVFGNGTYTAYGSDGVSTATTYGPGRIRMVMKADAKVIDIADLRFKVENVKRVLKDQLLNLDDEIRAVIRTADDSALSELVIKRFGELSQSDLQTLSELARSPVKGSGTRDAGAVFDEVIKLFGRRSEITTLNRLLLDEGRAATMLGYDAIDIIQSEYMIVLNRTAVIIEEKIGAGVWDGAYA